MGEDTLQRLLEKTKLPTDAADARFTVLISVKIITVSRLRLQKHIWLLSKPPMSCEQC
uniref:Uncharacterized protein n=1 Tax=Arion vulgaris TaxID=1028688 RepID=A0A0B7AGG1_9EUPU